MPQHNQYTLLNSLADGVLVIDHDFTIIFANKQFLQLYNLEMEDIVGNKCFSSLHDCLVPCPEECIANGQCGHKQVFATGQPIDITHSHVLPDGSKKIFQISISPLSNDKGKVDRIIHVTKDITEQEQLRKKLHVSLVEQRTIFNNSPYAVSYLDPEQRVKKINSLMEKLIGKTNAEVQGKYCYEVWGQYAEDSSKKGSEKICDDCRVQDAMTDGRSYSYEKTIGDSYIEVTSSPVKDENGIVIGALETGKDITERKQAEKQLYAYERILSATKDLMSFVDKQYIYQAVNDAYCKVHNKKRAEIVGKSVTELHGKEVFENTIKGHLNKTFTGELVCYEDWFDYHGAGKQCMEVTYYPFIDEHNVITGAVVTCRNITDRKKSEYLFREIFNNISNGIAIYEAVEDGSDFLIKDLNPAGLISGQVQKSDILNKSILETFPGIKEMGLFDILQEVYKTGESINQPGAFYKDEKRTLWMENFVCKLPSGEIVEVYNNITERKQAELELAKSKEEWERTFDSFTDIVTLQDPSMKIVKVNKAGCQILGLDKKEILAHHCYELFHGSAEPCVDCPLLETKKDFQSYTREMYHEKLGRTFLVSAAAVLDAKGDLEYIAHVAKDISALKKLEQELFQVQKMEAIGTLAGGIAHDFNNILSGILGYSELIKREVSPDSDAGKDIVEVIDAGQRATELVKQILTFSRKTDSSKKPLRPHLIVEEALKLLRATLPTTICIEEDIDPNCGTILADATNIHQTVVNLCTNALHAMADEKGTLNVSLKREELGEEQLIEETESIPGSFVVLSISDTGCGMDRETLNRIFEPYFTTKEVGTCTGLGLAVIHGIAKSNNGFVRVKSTPGKGSTFTVYLPALLEKDIAGNEKAQIVPSMRGNEHILIVDDEAFLVKVTQRQLENLGYRATGMTNSIDALKNIRTTPDEYDLIITDQTMPGITGAELALAVKEIKPEMPIILCTGHSNMLSKEKSQAIGIDKYIGKPIMGNELSDAIRILLDKKIEGGS